MGSEKTTEALTRISGVGSARARKLADGGYDRIVSVAHADAQTLAEDTGINEGHAEKVIAAARTLLKDHPELAVDSQDPEEADELVGTVRDLQHELSALRGRVEELSRRVDRLEGSSQSASAPRSDFVSELAAYIQEHMPEYSDGEVRSFLAKHGHVPEDIEAALSRARG